MSADQLNQPVRSPNSSPEQCSICFEDFTDQEIGIPEHCEHSFCFTCLIEWAKKEGTCPHDRQIFQYILKKHSFSSRKPYAKINRTDGQSEPYVEENSISCQACGGDDEEECSLLICTKCSNGYHTFCLNSFDTSTWMCPSCGYTHGAITEIYTEPVNTLRKIRRIKTFALNEQSRTFRITKPRRRLQQPASQNVVRRIENSINRNMPSSCTTIRKTVSDIPVRACPQSTVLINQVKNMAELQRKRKRFRRLPPRILISQLPRIQRRADAPIRPRPKTIAPKSNPPASASFMDKLLHAQKHLYSLENVRMQGAQIQLS